MSWDIFVQDLPEGIAHVDQIPDGFKPRPICDRSAILDAIRSVAPHAVTTDPTWVTIEVPGEYQIEVNLGHEESQTSFAFHVRGGPEARGVIGLVLDSLDLRALDPSSETGLFEMGSE